MGQHSIQSFFKKREVKDSDKENVLHSSLNLKASQFKSPSLVKSSSFGGGDSGMASVGGLSLVSESAFFTKSTSGTSFTKSASVGLSLNSRANSTSFKSNSFSGLNRNSIKSTTSLKSTSFSSNSTPSSAFKSPRSTFNIIPTSSSSFNTITVPDDTEDESPDTSFEVESFLDTGKRSSFFGNSQPKRAKRESSIKIIAESVPRRPTDDLSLEQSEVLREVIESRKNIFYTGSAGTGKSVVLKKLVEKLKIIHGDNLGVTASTGMAAVNINGQTIHKFLGIGIGTGSPLEITKRIKRNRMTTRKWQSLKVLIIDEISMIDGDLFDKINEIGQLIRGNRKPFGGIQVVVTGDFFQLPPVSKDKKATYCFQAKCWHSVIHKKIVLTKVFRQKGDDELISMLNALRSGNLTDEITSKFKQLSRKVNYNDGIEPTELFPTRFEVKNANLSRMRSLTGRTRTFMAIDSIPKDARPETAKQLDNLMCEKELQLKEGAQVMYLKNQDEIVNGSIGTVLFFLTKELWIKIYELYGDDLDDSMILTEIRLISSRIGNTDLWTPEETDAFRKVVPSERMSNFRKLCNLASDGDSALAYPIVNFKREKHLDLPFFVEPFDFSMDGAARQDQVLSRRQLPIILAWAMSIHKAQGQTIDRLKIDLTKSFEMGQIYVALSRATSKEHLEVKNFEGWKVKVSEDVVKFYNA